MENNIENQECADIKGTTECTSKKKCNRKHCIVAGLIAVVVLVLAFLILRSTPMKIHKLAKFTKQVEADYAQYSNSELEKATAKFEKQLTRLNKRELNGRQEEKVRDLRNECISYFAQAKARLILQEYNSAVDAAGEAVKDAIKSMKND